MKALDVLSGKERYAFETGDCIDIMRQLPDNCINVVVTSPPYPGLRDYGTAEWEGGDPACDHSPRAEIKTKSSTITGGKKTVGHAREGVRVCPRCGARRTDSQLGLERSVDCLGWATGNPCGECYTCKLVAVFDEVWRVLRDDGLVWLNIADAMNGFPGNANSAGLNSISRKSQKARQKKPTGYGLAEGNLKQLDMLGAPWSVAFALRARGWHLRADAIWAKISVMPSSTDGWRWERHTIGAGEDKEFCPGCDKCNDNNGLVLRRGSWKPTPSHEYIFQLAKKEQYFADPLAVRQLPAKASLDRIRQPNFWMQEGGDKDARNTDPGTHRSSRKGLENFAKNPGRNLWDVWVIPPTPLGEEHYAAFPSGLPELAIRSSVSQGGYCSTCGAPFARIVEQDIRGEDNPEWETESKWAEDDQANGHRLISRSAKLRKKGRNHDNPFPVKHTVGWKSTCSCGAEAKPGVVLDPFSGSGTTGRVAYALGVSAIGCDLNPDYNAMAERLISHPNLIIKRTHTKVETQQFSLFED